MRAEESREYQVGERQEWEGALFQSDRPVRQRGVFMPLAPLRLGSVFKKLVQGLRKLMVAGRYGLSRLKIGSRFHPGDRLKAVAGRLPWWKIGLAVLAVVIVLKKDIQFSVNMKAPAVSVFKEEESARAGDRVEELNVAQSIAFSEEIVYRPVSVAALKAPQVMAYVKRFTEVAISEMEKFGIPASIKMAQALLESQAGQHPATREQKNHFGRPLGGQVYESDWENWREHSLLLYHEYPALFNSGQSYKKWAQALRKVGYSKDRKYDRKLIEIIEKYQLYLLDDKIH